MSRLEGKQNNTVKLTLNELLCGFLGESLFLFHDWSQQVRSTDLTHWLDMPTVTILGLSCSKVMVIQSSAIVWWFRWCSLTSCNVPETFRDLCAGVVIFSSSLAFLLVLHGGRFCSDEKLPLLTSGLEHVGKDGSVFEICVLPDESSRVTKAQFLWGRRECSLDLRVPFTCLTSSHPRRNTQRLELSRWRFTCFLNSASIAPHVGVELRGHQAHRARVHVF